MGEKLDFKVIRAKLYQACQDFIENRKATATLALQQAVEASNDDTKSSAGDKYETTREMMQQEIDRNKKMLIDAGLLEQSLKQIALHQYNGTIQLGSLVFTNRGNFYLAIGAGKIDIDGETYYAISLGSPLGIKLQNKEKGNMFEFNALPYTILNVY